MGLFKSKKPQNSVYVQTRAKTAHPFYPLQGYAPLRTPELSVYSALREAIPILDAAVCKLIRLLGDFQVVCKDKSMQEQLNEFVKGVSVGPGRNGIRMFLETYFDQLLVNGTAVGEIVLSASGKNIAALYNAPLDHLKIKEGKSPLECVVCVENGNECKPVKNQGLVLLSSLNPDPGKICGNSLFKSMPFISEILLKIYQTIGVNYERMGNLRFAVTYKPSENSLDRANAKERAQLIAQQWSEAMQSSEPKDFISVGDVSIKVIGADNQMPDTLVPVRQMLEQLIAKTGIPPFMLGLSWSSTERMSSQQADILTSEIDAYRRTLEPVILKICNMWLRLNGCYNSASVMWSNINLQDEVELAKARLYNAQAMQLEKKLENGGTI
ncbi:MAG: serine/threonine protein phosphatase [Clostridia bacterium]|nr:serine/threonine protein phosphatase [Clostridia bacterium]